MSKLVNCLMAASVIVLVHAGSQGASAMAAQPTPTIPTGAAIGQANPGAPTEAPRLQYSSHDARLQLRMANLIDDTGEAKESLERRQQVFDSTLARLGSLPSSHPERVELIRIAADAGYFLAWGRYDQGDIAAGDNVVAALEQLLAPYDVAAVRPEMRLPIARHQWLKSRRAQELGQSDLDAKLRARVGVLTASRTGYDEDYGPLTKLRIVYLWSSGGESFRKARVEACRLARELAGYSAPDMLRRLVECDLEAAQNAISDKQYVKANASLAAGRKRLIDARRSDGTTLTDDILLVSIELKAGDLALAQEDKPEQARRQIAASRAFISTLDGKAYSQQSTDELKNLYSGFSEFDASVLPEYADPKARSRLQVEVFEGVAKALAKTQEAFPDSPGLAAIVGSSWGKASSAHRALDDLPSALAAGQSATAQFQRISLIPTQASFNEDAASECGAYNAHMRALVDLRRADDALGVHRLIEERCGAWLRRYPWDFYTRVHLESSSLRVGQLLVTENRQDEAAPLLQYASDWGNKDASRGLARLYRSGALGAPDLRRAKALDDLAEQQNMKRFTVPTDFGGVKFPFYMYVLQYGGNVRCSITDKPLPPESGCVGFYGVDDQIKWVKEARGGIVPPEVGVSFQKLDQIARDNNVSFPDLAVYALGEAQKPDGKTPPPPVVPGQLVVTANYFLSFDDDQPKSTMAPAQVISRAGPANCFLWTLSVAKEDRTIVFREDYFLPGPPLEPHGASKNSTVFDGGRKIVTKREASLDEGLLLNSWCMSKGDPLGDYRIEVFHEDRSLHTFRFLLVE
jgi:hypothetical protein